MSLDLDCKKFVWNSYLYYAEDNPCITDGEFDKLAVHLKDSWDKLPGWFTRRVPYADLEAGTGCSLHYSDEEIEAAIAYWEGIMDKPYVGVH